MPATYEPIATTTLSSAASSITFSSIASSWTDLRIVWNFQAVSASNYPYLQLNGDTSANYSYTTLYGTGTAAGSQRSSSNNGAYLVSYAAASTSQWQIEEIDIFSYAGSTYKTILNGYSGDTNGGGFVSKGVNLWRSTSAITSVTLKFDAGGNMAAGTTATLYGIKNA
jgi:hypothetical protein